MPKFWRRGGPEFESDFESVCGTTFFQKNLKKGRRAIERRRGRRYNEIGSFKFSVCEEAPMRHTDSVAVVGVFRDRKDALSRCASLRRGFQREVDVPFKTNTFAARKQT